MEQHLEQIRDQQMASWDAFSAGWKKWDELTMRWMQPVGNAMIRLVRPAGTDIVLDVAAGTGEPGLTIAGELTSGHVVLTDLSADMIAIAAENAVRRGISNVHTQTADVCELPFADNSFDAVTCRFGMMFVPDLALASSEIRRVLKPGGRFVTAVWGAPERNPWVTLLMGSIRRHLELPAVPSDAPGIFRCAADGMMAGVLRDAGFGHVDQTEVTASIDTGTAEGYWTMMTEIAAPITGALLQADAETRDRIKSEVFDAVHQMFPEGAVSLPSYALVISGEK